MSMYNRVVFVTTSKKTIMLHNIYTDELSRIAQTRPWSLVFRDYHNILLEDVDEKLWRLCGIPMSSRDVYLFS